MQECQGTHKTQLRENNHASPIFCRALTLPMTRHHTRSFQLYLLLFLVTGNPVTGFVPFTTTRSVFGTSGLLPRKQRALSPLLAFKPVAFLSDTTKHVGPLATLGLTLPQLQVGGCSMANIQRVGETSLAAMFVVAAIQGALVSLKNTFVVYCVFVFLIVSELL